MRIAVYHNLHSGGAKRTVAEELARLVKRHDVTLFTLSTSVDGHSSQANATKHVTEPFTPLHYFRSPFGRLNPIVTLMRFAQLLNVGRRVATAIDAGKFDIVLIHPCQYTQAPTVIGWLRTPTVYYCHELPRALYEPAVPRPLNRRNRFRRLVDNIDPTRPITRFFARAIDRWAALRATALVVNSQTTRNAVTKAYGRVPATCPPGVDADAMQQISGVTRERVVLSVGALTPNKGFDFLIRALATIPLPERPPLVIISNYQEDAERAYLDDLAVKLGVSVTLLVNVSEVELRSWYSRAGCVAYAPVREPLGLVALEAMAAGAPLVGVDEAGVAETVRHGETGLLVPREATRFGQAVHDLLSDQAKAIALGRAAALHVRRNWGWDRHVSGLEEQLVQHVVSKESAS